MNKAQKHLVYEELVGSLRIANEELASYRKIMASDMAQHLASEMAANIKLLALVKRSAWLLAEIPYELQDQSIIQHRIKLVDAINLHDPEYYGGSK